MAKCVQTEAAVVSSAGSFATTHWSVVLAASQDSPSEAGASEALETLCRTYWYPLYVYIRRRGYSPEDTQDLTQEFFARFLAGQSLARVDRERGKFRSYLLGALNHFLADAWDHTRRLKRGEGQHPLPLEVLSGEARYNLEPADELSPDVLYDRRWALTVLDQVIGKLRQEYERVGKGVLFEQLCAFLPGDAATDAYSAVALKLGMTEGAVRVAVHRLRTRYGRIFLREVAQTISDPAELQDEMRHLLAAASQ